jgi:prophage antirepressor-like protein
MNQLTKFVFPLTGQETRIVDHNGDPWFVRNDVCSILGLSNPSQASARLDDDEKGVISNETPGGVQEIAIINEAGLYNLILSSKKPEAKAFRRWVTHEVLPQIRKTGAYGETLQDALSSPDALRMILLGYTEKVIALEAKVAEQAPKVEALKRLEGADGSMCITDAAKALKVRPKDLFAYLSAQKWTYKRPGTSAWIGYQDKIQAGLIEMSEFTQLGSDGVEKVRVRARITAKGLARLAAEFNAVPSN